MRTCHYWLAREDWISKENWCQKAINFPDYHFLFISNFSFVFFPFFSETAKWPQAGIGSENRFYEIVTDFVFNMILSLFSLGIILNFDLFLCRRTSFCKMEIINTGYAYKKRLIFCSFTGIGSFLDKVVWSSYVD